MSTTDQELADLIWELPPEARAEVRDFIKSLVAKQRRQERASAPDIMNSRGGAFNSADEVDDYLRQERDTWER